MHFSPTAPYTTYPGTYCERCTAGTMCPFAADMCVGRESPECQSMHGSITCSCNRGAYTRDSNLGSVTCVRLPCAIGEQSSHSESQIPDYLDTHAGRLHKSVHATLRCACGAPTTQPKAFPVVHKGHPPGALGLYETQPIIVSVLKRAGTVAAGSRTRQHRGRPCRCPPTLTCHLQTECPPSPRPPLPPS